MKRGQGLAAMEWRRAVLPVICWMLLWVSGPTTALALSNLQVKGLGWLENGRMEKKLVFLLGMEGAERAEWDAIRVEDTAFLSLQLLRRAGYPDPEVELVLRSGEDKPRRVRFGWPFTGRVANGTRPDEVVVHCRPGQLAWYDTVNVAGLSHLSAEEAEFFFIPGGALVTSRRQRAYTESNLETRIGRLLEVLREEGYREARLVDRKVEQGADGAVTVSLRFAEGPVYHVVEIKIQETDRVNPPTGWERPDGAAIILSGERMRRWRQELLNDALRRGFPEAEVAMRVEKAGPVANAVQPVSVIFERRWGPRYRFGGVSFTGEDGFEPSVLRRQADLEELEYYSVPAIEEGRRRLLGLGVLEAAVPQEVDLGAGTRGVRYQLEPGKRQSLTVRLGWGSYERARAGLRWEQRNPFGRAHRYGVEARYSLKALRLQADYTIPHFFDEGLWARARVGYRYREEIDFERTTREARFSLSRRLGWPGSSVQLAYLLEDVRAERASAVDFPALDEALVTSIEGNFNLERRDDTLFPTRGYALSVRGKWAAESLGGEANFWKGEVTLSGHWPVRASLLLHGSLRYGLLQSDQPRGANLPFGERFFPGGDRSIRGYQRGEAAPRLPGGDLVGAESYALANAEMEVRLTDQFSAVLFWDGLLMDREGAALPEDESLYSVGLGIRWRTLVGPVRLEYGWNPDPRFHDPDGTLHLAIGFPF